MFVIIKKGIPTGYPFYFKSYIFLSHFFQIEFFKPL